MPSRFENAGERIHLTPSGERSSTPPANTAIESDTEGRRAQLEELLQNPKGVSID